MSKKFTKPIVEMQEITKRINNLEFDDQVIVSGHDELATLAHNINELSVTLDEALSELSDKNASLVEELKKERQLDYMRKSFVSNVSHELRTPLSIIEGYAEGISLKIAQDSESATEYSNIIIKEIGHMSKLIDNILDLSILDSETVVIKEDYFDIVSLAEKIAQSFSELADHKNCKIKVEKQNDEAFAFADSFRIEQVMRNYVINAINYCDDNTTILIDIQSNHNSVKVSVFNDGNILDTNEIKNVWTEFYKRDQSRNRDTKQHGLGLSIVSSIMRLHANSEYGAYPTPTGMCFWFSLDNN